MADITFSNLQNAIFMVITSICIVGYFGKFYYCFWYNISEIKWMYTFYQKNEKKCDLSDVANFEKILRFVLSLKLSTPR